MADLQGRERAHYVRDMFERIAGRYDLMNRLMTFGQDRRWRRYVIQQARLDSDALLLDVATGTGDIAQEGLRQHPDITVVGLDFAPTMMTVGRDRLGRRKILWCDGDAINLPFPDSHFDAAVSGYLMRNVIDVPRAFREQMRVVKPSGWIVTLDTTPPPPNLLRPFILIHLRFVIPLLGRLIAGDDSAYSYLPESTEGFKTPEELATIMRDVGLQEVSFRRFMFGTMAVHMGRRPQAEEAG
ncbi:MAG: ubiquinone/menaquinone biosynthesis methyltransferase [Chloroflexi bacterium]|nr:ubiquinone/menaquinone biosynthesis methyltransferase [Chloroflexota bacterium]